MSPTPAPWDQQTTESDRAFEAFRSHRDKGPQRTLRGLSDELGVHMSQLKEWALANNWEPRLRAWTREQDRAVRRQRRAEQLAMAEGHRKIGQMLAQKAMERFAEIDLDVLKPSDVVALIRLGTDLEKNSFSYATEDLESVTAVAHVAAEKFGISVPDITQKDVPLSFGDILQQDEPR